MKSAPGLVNYERFISPMLDVLRDLGGSGRSAEVKDALYRSMDVSEAEQQERTKGGELRLGTQINFARLYLAKAGFIDSSSRGVWVLTDKGHQTHLSAQDVKQLSRAINAIYYANARANADSVADAPGDGMVEPSNVIASTVAQGDYRAALMSTLKALPPSGFERICGLLLRELDFENVVITGRTGDGGIDGHGTLRVGKLLPTKIYFQCKRYADSVGPSTVRDFRGALVGRGERGVILTTGLFTSAAQQEATRDGATAIELVDGERLITLFEDLGIGLKPRKAFDVDEEFFAKFRA